MNNKLIFLDIDGTLTPAGSNLPPQSAQEAIRRAQAKGHRVFLCTGRNYKMLSPLIPYGFDGIVGGSGSYVEVEGKVIYDHPLKNDQRDRILQTLHQCGAFCTVESRDGSYTDEGFKEFLEAHANEGSNSELLRWRRQIESNLSILPMSCYEGEPAYKVIFMSVGMSRIKAAVEELSRDFAVVVQDPDQFGIVNGEIVCKGLDKGAAIGKVADYLGMSMEDTVGFGDSNNDIEMMEVVGLSVCMANGTETLKKMADEICPAVEEDGLYRSFEDHGWI